MQWLGGTLVVVLGVAASTLARPRPVRSGELESAAWAAKVELEACARQVGGAFGDVVVDASWTASPSKSLGADGPDNHREWMRSRRVIGLLAVAACNGGGSSTPAGGDASTDAPASTSVAIIAYTSTGDGAPDPTAIAICSDASGATIQHGPVDANGQAQCDLADGGSVTVLQVTHDPTNLALVADRLTTFRDVAPGDHLVVGEAGPLEPGANGAANCGTSRGHRSGRRDRHVMEDNFR